MPPESPPKPLNGALCANAGVINIAPPEGHAGGRTRAARDEGPILRAKSARTIAAIGLNCNAAAAGVSAKLAGMRRGPAKGSAATPVQTWPNLLTRFRRKAATQNGRRRAKVASRARRTAIGERRMARADRRRPGTARPAPAGRARFCRRRGLRLAPGGPQLGAGAPRQPCRHVASQGHRSGARSLGREHRALRPRPAGQQCAAVGRARHGQVVARQGRARGDRRRASRRRA